MQMAEAVVRELCASVEKRDLNLLNRFVTDDINFHNIGMPLIRGRTEFSQAFEQYWKMFPDNFEFLITNLGTSKKAVFTERIDIMGVDGKIIRVPVLGIFEVIDGRVARWRDYADLGLVAKLLSGDPCEELVPHLP